MEDLQTTALRQRTQQAVRKATEAIWTACAISLGWEWSGAYSGYFRVDQMKPGTTGANWSDYRSDIDAEEACSLDCIDTFGAAIKHLEEQGLVL